MFILSFQSIVLSTHCLLVLMLVAYHSTCHRSNQLDKSAQNITLSFQLVLVFNISNSIEVETYSLTDQAEDA